MIRVAPGNYGPILLVGAKSLSILGRPGAKTSAPWPNGIYQLPAGKTQVLSRLEISGLYLMNNQGTIVLHDVQSPSLLFVYSTSRAHVYRSRLRGGEGGDDWEFGIFGGSGGSGIHVSGSTILLAGDAASFVQSGSNGWPVGDTLPALALASGSHLRLSGFQPDSKSLDATSTQESPVPADPTPTLIGRAAPGAVWEIAVRAQTGSLPLLLVGRNPIQPQPTTASAEVQLVVPTHTIAMPATDGSGLSTYAFALPMHLPAQGGLLYFAQASVALPNGQTRFTNSVPLILR